MELIHASQPEARVLPALVISCVFGVLGWLSRGVTFPGVVAGTLVGFAIYVGLGLGGFATLFGVFALTWLTTRIGHARKRQLGVAENKRGRTARQVLANIVAAAMFALLALRFGPVCAVAAVASLAEAAADTVSSELGEVLSSRPRLITSWRPVAAGTNGAVSAGGTLAGLAAAVAIAAIAAAFRVVPLPWAWIPACAGFIGTVGDSLLGATVENRGRIGNDGVNFLSTVISAIVAVILYVSLLWT